MITCIVVLLYERNPEPLLTSLLNNDLTHVDSIYFSVDRSDSKESREAVLDAIRIFQRLCPCTCEVKIAEERMGLKTSVESTLDNLACKADYLIVLEDDLVIHPRLMNFFQDNYDVLQNPNISHVSGYCNRNFADEFLFLDNFGSIWGWAIRSDDWLYYRRSHDQLFSMSALYQLMKLSYGYALIYCLFFKGYSNSWAIHLLAFNVAVGRSVVCPSKSFISNQGINSGTNSLGPWRQSNSISWKGPTVGLDTMRVESDRGGFSTLDLLLLTVKVCIPGSLLKRLRTTLRWVLSRV